MPLSTPVPHPSTVFDCTGWRGAVLGRLIGEAWPEGDERALRELAEQWNDAAKRIGPLLEDADQAVLAAAAALGGPEGRLAGALLEAWRRMGTPLSVDLFNGLGELAEAGAGEIEAAKVQIVTEVAALLAELEILAATTGVTLGVSAMCAEAAIVATRAAIAQILERAANELAERGSKVAKEAVPLGRFSFGSTLELSALADASESEATPESVDGGDFVMAYGVGSLGGSMVGAMSMRPAPAKALKGRYGERAIRGRSSEVRAQASPGVITPPPGGPASPPTAPSAASASPPASVEATTALSALDNALPPAKIEPASFTLAALSEVKDMPQAGGPTPEAGPEKLIAALESVREAGGSAGSKGG